MQPPNFLIKRTGESFIDLYPPNDFFSFGGANIKPVNVFSQNLDLVEKRIIKCNFSIQFEPV
jgi:hypothetical protein